MSNSSDQDEYPITHECECGWEGSALDMKSGRTRTESGAQVFSNYLCPDCERQILNALRRTLDT